MQALKMVVAPQHYCAAQHNVTQEKFTNLLSNSNYSDFHDSLERAGQLSRLKSCRSSIRCRPLTRPGQNPPLTASSRRRIPHLWKWQVAGNRINHRRLIGPRMHALSAYGTISTASCMAFGRNKPANCSVLSRDWQLQLAGIRATACIQATGLKPFALINHKLHQVEFGEKSCRE